MCFPLFDNIIYLKKTTKRKAHDLVSTSYLSTSHTLITIIKKIMKRTQYLIRPSMKWTIQGSDSSRKSSKDINTTSDVIQQIRHKHVTFQTFKRTDKIAYLEARCLAAAVEQFISCSAWRMKRISRTLASRVFGLYDLLPLLEI